MSSIQNKTNHTIFENYTHKANVVLYPGDCLELLKQIPDNSIQLIVTSPPYNIGKEYEKKLNLETYIDQQQVVIKECYRILKDSGSICWQVGNYIEKSSIIPLDTILYPTFANLKLKMRNRIIWHFEHGLHCKKRFSGRYETIMWFTKSDEYVFNLDPVRVPQKYPGKKHFKGPKIGEYSGNPLGKNPSDIWIIPNVKSNHVEKTDHPCQFPVALIERLVLSLSNKKDRILDPFLGTGTSIIAALKHKRIGIGAEIYPKYIEIARERIRLEILGNLKTRPLNKPIFDPKSHNNKSAISPWTSIDSKPILNQENQ